MRTSRTGWARGACWPIRCPGSSARGFRKAGDPIPSRTLTLYRGVSGRGAARRGTGLSWTANPDVARWFAGRDVYGADCGDGAAPALYRLQVDSRSVLTHLITRGEDEFLVDPKGTKPTLFEHVTREGFERACARLRDASVKS